MQIISSRPKRKIMLEFALAYAMMILPESWSPVRFETKPLIIQKSFLQNLSEWGKIVETRVIHRRAR
jgi:hypothetical protein